MAAALSTRAQQPAAMPRAAPETGAAGTPLRPVPTFCVRNLDMAERDEFLAVSIPFKPGEIPDEQALSAYVVEGRPTAWRTLIRHPDGSILMAQAQARFVVGPYAQGRFSIVPGAALTALGKFTAPPIKIKLLWTDEQGVTRACTTVRDKVMEQTALRQVLRYRGAITNEQGREPLGLTVWSETWADCPRGYLSLMAAADALEKPVPVVKIKELAIETDGTEIVPLWPQKEKGLVARQTTNGTRVVLLRDHYMVDNSGKAYRFAWGPVGDRSLQGMADRPLYPLCTPETFKSRQAAIGILGYVPSLAQGATPEKATAFMDRRWPDEHLAETGPWDHLGYTCSQSPGATGDQADFGVLALYRTYQSGHPGELMSAMAAGYRESCRINHFYGLDAKKLLRAKVVFWTERINERAVADGVLGRTKAHWDAIYNGGYRYWCGYDEEHMSLNSVYEAWSLTGDPFLWEELNLHYQHLALCYLNDAWHKGGIGNRAMGRMAHAALLCARAVGDPWVVQGIIEKFRQHALPAFERNKAEFPGVAAFALWRNVTDGRQPRLNEGMPGRGNDMVCNWQDGLIAWAVGQLPDPTMKQMAYEVGKSMCLNGFDFGDGTLKTYYAAWDPSRCSKGGIGETWYYPSMRWAATEAIRRQDLDAGRMKEAADRVLAKIAIPERLEGGAFAPSHRWTAIPEK
jgi:hypothetical protein